MEITDKILLEKLTKIANLNGLSMTDLISNSHKHTTCVIRNAICEVLFKIDSDKYDHTFLADLFHRKKTTICNCLLQSKLLRSYNAKCEKIYNSVKEILVL